MTTHTPEENLVRLVDYLEKLEDKSRGSSDFRIQVERCPYGIHPEEDDGREDWLKPGVLVVSDWHSKEGGWSQSAIYLEGV